MKKKILIIDDSDEFAASTADVLESNGYEIFRAENGKAGTAAAQKYRPDCILLDVMMEDAGAGLDTVKALNEDKATAAIPVYLVTGIKKPEYLLDSYAPGTSFSNVKGTLEKPVDPQVLISKVADAVT